MRRVAVVAVLACGTLLASLVGGFGTLTGGTAPADTDRDGLPDTWERANGLNPNDAGDGDDSSGYSTVERYLNSLVP